MSSATATKWVYDFAEGSRDMRELLGGKGSGIAEMTRVLGGRRRAGRTERCAPVERNAIGSSRRTLRSMFLRISARSRSVSGATPRSLCAPRASAGRLSARS
jgi:hypothetical protein